MIHTLSDLRHALQSHAARYPPTTLGAENAWNTWHQNRGMVKRTRKDRKHGGASYALTGAPLNYAMIPGSAFTTNPTVAVYDRFPIDPTVNPQVVSDLDVFFGSALSRGCGVEDTSLKVPADMGSNQVGGKGRRTRYKRGGASDTGFFSSLGDFGTTTAHHPYMATAYPNTAQSLTNQWQGKLDPVPTSSDPTDHTWKYAAEQVPTVVANPANWATALGPTPYLMRVSAQAGGRKRTLKTKIRKTKSRKHRKIHRK